MGQVYCVPALPAPSSLPGSGQVRSLPAGVGAGLARDVRGRGSGPWLGPGVIQGWGLWALAASEKVIKKRAEEIDFP